MDQLKLSSFASQVTSQCNYLTCQAGSPHAVIPNIKCGKMHALLKFSNMRVICGLRCHVDKLAASEQLPASESTADRSVRESRGQKSTMGRKKGKEWDFVHVIKEGPDTEELGDTGRQCLQHKCKEMAQNPAACILPHCIKAN